jgi:hypothetical protein
MCEMAEAKSAGQAAPAKKTAARKPTVKKPEVVTEAPVAEVDVIKAAKIELEQDLLEVEQYVREGADVLKTKTVAELRVIHDQAIRAEDEAKRLVHVLRQRANNAVVDVDTTAEEEIIAAKKELAKAAQWLRQVEKALEDEFKDIYETRFGVRR